MLRETDRQLIHKYIVCDLTIKSIERDIKHLSNLKLETSLSYLLTDLLKTLEHQFKYINVDMRKAQIKMVGHEIKVEHFIIYTVTKSKIEETITYSNHALHNYVNETVSNLIKLNKINLETKMPMK